VSPVIIPFSLSLSQSPAANLPSPPGFSGFSSGFATLTSLPCFKAASAALARDGRAFISRSPFLSTHHLHTSEGKRQVLYHSSEARADPNASKQFSKSFPQVTSKFTTDFDSNYSYSTI